MYSFLDTYFNGWQAELAGMVLSIVIASIVLPWMIEWRQLRALVHARAILISRADAFHQAIASYAQALLVAEPSGVAKSRESALVALKKFMNVPTELSAIMRGRLGEAYFAYRLEATWLIGDIANAHKDYQSGFDLILPVNPPQHRRPDAGVSANRLYLALHRRIGRDALKVPNWRRLKDGWDGDQLTAVLKASKSGVSAS